MHLHKMRRLRIRHKPVNRTEKIGDKDSGQGQKHSRGGNK